MNRLMTINSCHQCLLWGAGGGFYNTIKDLHRYAVQESDTTIMTIAS